MNDPLERHERIAFQFSGGRDSTAALFLLRDHWPRMTVYWLNSGDAFPETARFVRDVGAMLPHFIEIPGRVNEIIAAYGPPADMVPFSASEGAWLAGVGKSAPLQDRALCCVRSKMLPMHHRMVDDHVTLIVRGQKNSDAFRGPLKSGEADGGIEVYYPIEDWSDADVMKWIIDNDIPQPPLYEHGILRSGDCMTCSAWLGDRRAPYLHAHHPEAFAVYAQRVAMCCDASSPVIGSVFGEMETIGTLLGEDDESGS